MRAEAQAVACRSSAAPLARSRSQPEAGTPRLVVPQTDAGAESTRQFVTVIEKIHGRALRRFLAVCMRRAAADIPDLVQEVFLRLLRIADHESIRSPQAYLYTVASHVLHQYLLRQAVVTEPLDPLDIAAEPLAPLVS